MLSYISSFGALLLLISSARGQEWPANRTLSIGYVSVPSSVAVSESRLTMLQVMFPGFEPLDVFGPLEILFWVNNGTPPSKSLD